MMTWRKRAEHPCTTAFFIGLGALVFALGMLALAILLLQGMPIGK